MTVRRKTQKALAILLPAGVLGISSALASVHSEPLPAKKPDDSYPRATVDRALGVDQRLREIRAGVLEVSANAQNDPNADPEMLVAGWLNGGFGWRNGGWGNGGWHNWGNGGFHNGGWGNGWHNAPNWGNGGWGNGWHNAPNWGNGGWHNWHNFWHNW